MLDSSIQLVLQMWIKDKRNCEDMESHSHMVVQQRPQCGILSTRKHFLARVFWSEAVRTGFSLCNVAFLGELQKCDICQRHYHILHIILSRDMVSHGVKSVAYGFFGFRWILLAQICLASVLYDPETCLRFSSCFSGFVWLCGVADKPKKMNMTHYAFNHSHSLSLCKKHDQCTMT